MEKIGKKRRINTKRKEDYLEEEKIFYNIGKYKLYFRIASNMQTLARWKKIEIQKQNKQTKKFYKEINHWNNAGEKKR